MAGDPRRRQIHARHAGPHDELLRKRLFISGDLPATRPPARMTTTVVEGVKRFQSRHGLAPTGTMTPRTLAALNVSVQKRIKQLEASLERLGHTKFPFGQRYVVVNLPATFAEAIENDKVVRRYRVDRRQDRKAVADADRRNHQRQSQPDLDRAGVDREKRRSRRICARIRATSPACIWRCSAPMMRRSIRIRWTGPAPIRRISRCASNPAPSMRSARSRSTCRTPTRSICTTPTSAICSTTTTASIRMAARASTMCAISPPGC